ncbi:hypothetical protein D3C72_2093270 [compost metagenome]
MRLPIAFENFRCTTTAQIFPAVARLGSRYFSFVLFKNGGVCHIDIGNQVCSHGALPFPR